MRSCTKGRVVADLGQLPILGRSKGLLLSIVCFCLILEVGGVPRLLIQKIVRPGHPHSSRIILPAPLSLFACLHIRLDACKECKPICSGHNRSLNFGDERGEFKKPGGSESQEEGLSNHRNSDTNWELHYSASTFSK